MLFRSQAVAAVTSSAARQAGDDGDGNLLILVVGADIAQALGAILSEETGLRRRLVVVDGVELTDFDFIDVGEYRSPPGVLPVLIKSLLFAPASRDGASAAGDGSHQMVLWLAISSTTA